MANASIRTQLDRLVALCVIPAAGLVGLTLATGLHPVVDLDEVTRGGPESVFRWLGIALALLFVGALVYAAMLARRIANSVQGLAQSAADLAEGRSLPTGRAHIKEAEEIASAIARAAELLRERTLQRDQATAAEGYLRRAEQALQHQATHDDLTGLLNRRCFDALLFDRVAACGLGASSLTLFYVDIDGFKQVNDRHGHAVGDELIRLFAARLKGSVRESETVARLGGDEFAVLLDQGTQPQALSMADALIDRLSRPYRVGQLRIEVSASIGLAAYPNAGSSARELLAAADAAMYRAKTGGKCRHVTSGFAPL